MEWLNEIFRQVGVIAEAPVPFAIVLIAAIYGTYLFVRNHYQERLATMESRLALRDDEIASLKSGATLRHVNPAPTVSVPAPIETEQRRFPEPLHVAETPPSERVFVDEAVYTVDAHGALCGQDYSSGRPPYRKVHRKMDQGFCKDQQRG